jgi:DNA-binding LytR/AlgR family response regulator
MRKALIIHPDKKLASTLQDYLKMTPGIIIAGIFASLPDAAGLLDDLNCDILFSSINVLGDLVDAGKELPVMVSLDADAAEVTQSVSKHIFGWLQMPFSYERILSLLQTTEHYMKQLSSTSRKDYIFIKSEYKLIKINLADILFMSGLRDYTQVFLKGRVSPLTTLQNLKDFESKLPDTDFIRVHRSYIVSISQIDSISRNEITMGTHTIPIGNAYRQMLDDMIEKNS